MRAFLFNVWHNGDVILNRPLLLAIKSKYPSLDVLLGCDKNKAYLWEDLGYPIFSLNPSNGRIARHVTTRCAWTGTYTDILTDFGYSVSDPALPGVAHHMWPGTYLDILASYGMTYQTQILSFNRAFTTCDLSLAVDGSPKISFPQKREIKVPNNSILVENGSVDSGQSIMPLDAPILERLAKTFPQYCFICSAKPNLLMPNILDFSGHNLIELSQVGDKAIAIISRGSAVHVCTLTEKNKSKPKFLCGWSCPWKIWDGDGLIYIKTHDELISALKERV